MITTNTVGKGRAILVGTFLGGAYDAQERPQLGQFVESLAGAAGIQAPVRPSGGCFVFSARSGDSRIVFLTNPSTAPAVAWLRFAPGKSGTLMDMLTDERIASISTGEPVGLPLAGEDSRILQFRSG